MDRQGWIKSVCRPVSIDQFEPVQPVVENKRRGLPVRADRTELFDLRKAMFHEGSLVIGDFFLHRVPRFLFLLYVPDSLTRFVLRAPVNRRRSPFRTSERA